MSGDSSRYDVHARRVNDSEECGVGRVLFGTDQRGRSGKRIMKIQGHLPAYLFSVAEALICLVVVFFFLASVPLTFRALEPDLPPVTDLQSCIQAAVAPSFPLLQQFPVFTCTVYTQMSSVLVAAGLRILASVVTVLLILVFSMFFFQQSLGVVVDKFGLTNFSISKLAFTVMSIHAIGTGTLVFLQYNNHVPWFFGLSNYITTMTVDGATVSRLDVARALEMVLLAPMVEEVLFRGLMLHVVLNRSHSVVPAILQSSTLFAFLHLLNLVHVSKYTPEYIVMQVTLGYLIGCFYGLRVIHRASLIESIALHSANNLFSSLLPTEGEIPFHHPVIQMSLMCTTVVYGYLTWRDYRALQKAKQHTQ